MFQKLKIAALSAVVALGALGATAATAQADRLSIGVGSAGVVDVQYRSNHNRHHYHKRPVHRAACTPRNALNKAHRMGVNRPFVRNANRNVIRVGGHSRGHRVNLVFARAPGCPVLR